MTSEPTKSGLRILLIEDSEDDALLVRHLLERVDWVSLDVPGFELKHVASYDEGLDEILTHVFDIALIDYLLEARTGVDLLFDARSKDCYAPIIILTGRADRHIDIAAMRAGAVEYLEKDKLNETLLEHVLRYALAQGRSESTLRQVALNSQELAQQNGLLAAALSNLTDGVTITDPRQKDNPIIFANSAFLALTGYSEAEVLGRNCRFLQGSETDAVELKRICEAVRAGRPWNTVLLNYRKDGSQFWNQVKIAPVFDAAGQLTHFVGTQSDITRRKLAEESVRFQARLLDTVGQAVIATDLDGTIAYLNEAAEQLYRWPEQDALGQNCLELVVLDAAEPDFAALLEGTRRGEHWTGELLMQSRDGVRFPVSLTNSPIANEDGELIGLINVVEDISERKKNEQIIRDTEARFQSIVANTPGMVFRYLLHPNGSYEVPFVSEGCRELLEFEPDQRNNPNLELDIFDEAEASEFHSSISESAATLRPWQWEGRIRLPSGKEKWISGASRPQRLPDGATLWDGLLTDITERKRAELLLGDQSKTLEMVARGVPLSETLDHLCRLMENQLPGAMCSVLCLSEDGETLRHGAAPSLPAAYNQAVDGISVRRSVGSCGAAAASGQPIVIQDIAHSVLWADYAELADEHGLAACWSNPIFDANRNLLGTFGVYYKEVRQPTAEEWQFIERATDIAAIALERQNSESALRRYHDDLERRVAQRTAELERAREEAEAARVRAEQLRQEADFANAAKSEFLSRMSHELRTPLNAILGFGQILEMRELGVKENMWVEQILRGGRHLLELINEVLDITRVEAGDLELAIEVVPVAAIVAVVTSLVKPLAVESNVFLSEKTEGLAPYSVMADPLKLKQVLLNLLSNAIKYNRPQGTVSVSARELADGMLRIAVRDSGPGIASDDLPKLFTPFERLGAINTNIEGTGLGLVLSRRLVEAMGGKLEVESAVGQGSVFTIELPAATAGSSAALVAPTQTRTGAAEGAYSILCIEDNLANLRLIETIMQERADVSLLAAMQGSVGLDLARQHKPDLILLDLNLPDLDGKEILNRLKQTESTGLIPVVVISSDASPQQEELVMKLGAHSFLPKPLDVPMFLRTVDDILQDGEAPS